MTDCTHPRSRGAKRCRACSVAYLNSSPEAAARRREGLARHWSDPANVEEARQRMIAVTAATMADPIQAERRREHGRRQHREYLSRPDVVERCLSAEARKKAGEARTRTVLAWCPPEKLARYRRLAASGIGAARAREVVEREIAAEARRHVEMRIEANRRKHERAQAQAY